MNKDTIVIATCKCGGYGQCFNAEAEAETGVCHRGIGEDIFGHYVAAKIKGENDWRQGVVISVNPFIIRGEFGVYECEGKPTIVDA